MNIYDLQRQLNELQEAIIVSSKLLPANKFGLDPRCGHLLLGEDFIASSAPRLVDYYGGFEYVSTECVIQVGTWKVYSIDDGSVQAAWERANDV